METRSYLDSVSSVGSADEDSNASDKEQKDQNENKSKTQTSKWGTDGPKLRGAAIQAVMAGKTKEKLKNSFKRRKESRI